MEEEGVREDLILRKTHLEEMLEEDVTHLAAVLGEEAQPRAGSRVTEGAGAGHGRGTEAAGDTARGAVKFTPNTVFILIP